MEFKKGDELKVRFSTTKFDYDDDGNVIGFENSDEFKMDLMIYDKDNVIDSSTIYTKLDLEDAINLDLEDEMKSLVEEFAKENNIKNYSLKDITVEYGENNVYANLVIE